MAEPIVEAQENLTASANVTGAKTPSTPEGMFIAYGSLVLMALFPILIGAFRSVRHHKEQRVNVYSINNNYASIFNSAIFIHLVVYINTYSVYLKFQESGEKPDTMTHKDAAMFPIIASAALFGLYVFFQVRVMVEYTSLDLNLC